MKKHYIEFPPRAPRHHTNVRPVNGWPCVEVSEERWAELVKMDRAEWASELGVSVSYESKAPAWPWLWVAGACASVAACAVALSAMI
jgi:hypothetical protein